MYHYGINIINYLQKMLFENTVEIKLKSGQILAFDNTRIVHGRQKYDDLSENRRHLFGNYLDWDEIFSKICVLKPEFT